MASHVTVSIVRLCYPNSAVVTVSLAAVFSQKRLRGKLSDTNTDSEISWTFVPRERLAGSFLNFVPELLQRCRIVFTELYECCKVIHLFHKEINDNHDNWDELSLSRNEHWNEENHLYSWYIIIPTFPFLGQNKKKIGSRWLHVPYCRGLLLLNRRETTTLEITHN